VLPKSLQAGDEHRHGHVAYFLFGIALGDRGVRQHLRMLREHVERPTQPGPVRGVAAGGPLPPSARSASVVLRDRAGVAGRRRVVKTASSPAAARTFRSVLQPGSTRPASMRVTVVGEMPAISARARTDKPAAVRARLTASFGSSTA
jgi:hypothetical protein